MQVLSQASNIAPSHAADQIRTSAAAVGAKDLLTSEQWWQHTKSDQERLMRWLRVR
jgi:hypothetical protein